MGDTEFFTAVIQPMIEKTSQWPGANVPPKDWDQQAIEQAWPQIKQWMEFDFVINSLRTEYLVQKRMARNP